jgi:Uma2 family endonuclease
MTIPTRLTVASLDALPEGDGQRYELIEGELYVTTQPHMEHQIVADAVCRLLQVWNHQSEQRGIAISAPAVVFASDEATAPDVVWVGRTRLAALRGTDGRLHGAPDLIVEVLAPGAKSEKRDREIKRARYAHWGVREYWLIDRVSRLIEVYRLSGGGYTFSATLGIHDSLSSPILPGFFCQVSEIFADLPV